MEAIRDVLLFPRPPNVHMGNRQLVQDKDCWKQVLATLELINATVGPQAVDHIAINFGQWETETSHDPNTLSCHAHVHYLLTTDAVVNCGDDEKVANSPAPLFTNMQGRQGDPVNYRLLDAEGLQLRVLLGEENKLLAADADRGRRLHDTYGHVHRSAVGDDGADQHRAAEEGGMRRRALQAGLRCLTSAAMAAAQD